MGCFSVPMVHSAVLFDMRRAQSKHLSYSSVPDGYEGPKDDIIILAHNIKVSGRKTDLICYTCMGSV